MSIAYTCRELVVGPTVGYQVGGQGDGSGYLRQQPHQQLQQQQQVPHQQGAVVRGLSCISIYVHSDEKAAPSWTDSSDGRGEDIHEVFNSVGKEKPLMDPHQLPAGAAASLLLAASKDSVFNLGAEFKVDTGDSKNIGVKTGVIGDSTLFQHSSVLAIPKDDSVSDASSSIGRNDSLHSTDDDEDTAGDMEVESKLKGPLDSLTELENSLPIKRGLSNFFSGKSKSFTCLTDAISLKDLAKPDNPYNKRRKNLLYSSGLDRSRFHYPRNNSAGIYKKGIHASKSTLALAVAMSQSEDSLERDEKDGQLPPLPPQGKCQRSFVSPRSFSLTDLQGV